MAPRLEHTLGALGPGPRWPRLKYATGSGCDQIDLHVTYRIGHTTVGKILRRICGVIWEVLRAESFPELTEEQWRDIAEGFQNFSQFPNCLGAIDGKHVRIRKPKMSGSIFYNYNIFFSNCFACHRRCKLQIYLY